MNLINGLNQLSIAQRPCVASIGNYDGVHLGHQHVIQTLLAKGQELSLPTTIVTFDPLAKEYFAPEHTSRIASLEERVMLLSKLGVDQVLVIAFNEAFASYSPEGFVNDVLIEGLGVRYLAVGDDFRFGYERAGDFSLLKTLGETHDFEVVAHETFEYRGERVSSGRVRAALAASDFNLAGKLLGRPFTIAGVVSKGQQLGRTISFPTANIVLAKYQLPLAGVFAVRVQMPGGEEEIGVANIGTRPTVDGTENRLEVHLFDYAGDLYGDELRVQPLFKIRDEQKFESLQVLQSQIINDVRQAREFFAEPAAMK